jgi:phosphatidate cytidylyltransferase
MNKNLVQRIIFAVWAIPLGYWAVNSTLSIVPPQVGAIHPGEALAVALTLGACVEYTRMLESFFPFNGFWLGYLWMSLVLVTHLLNVPLPTSLSIYLLLMLVALEAFFFGKKTKRRWNRASLFFSGNVFLFICGLALLYFFQDPYRDLFKYYSAPMLSQVGLVLMVTAVFLCDTGAYIVGSLMGRHHFTTISPNKTVEGSIGGFVFALLATVIGWYFIANPRYPLIAGVILGILIGIFAQLGDLLVSLIKRYFGVKDASDIIPGHGGILDRFGSVFFTAPIVWLYTWGIHKIMG